MATTIRTHLMSKITCPIYGGLYGRSVLRPIYIKLSELKRIVAKTGGMDRKNGGRGRPARPAEVPVRDVVPMPHIGAFDAAHCGRNMFRPYNLPVCASKTHHQLWQFLKLTPMGRSVLRPCMWGN